jgi:hypothetical protein
MSVLSDEYLCVPIFSFVFMGGWTLRVMWYDSMSCTLS